MLAPLGCIGYALVVLRRGQASLGRHGELVVQGRDVVVYCLPLFCLAFLLHAHFFWGNTARLEAYSGLGKWVGVFAFVASLLFLAFRVYRPF